MNNRYFPHDFYSRRDPKLVALKKEFGLSGLGVYWQLMEILHEQGGKIKKFPKLIFSLAIEIGENEMFLTKQIEAMLRDYELLQEDDQHIWSPRVLSNISNINLKYEKKSKAGKIGGVKSGEARKNKTKQNEQNKIKINKIKENIIMQADACKTTPREYLEKMLLDKKPHVQVIARYLQFTDQEFPTVKAIQNEIRRWSKTAVAITQYPIGQFEQAMEFCHKNFQLWSLEAVLKNITRV